MEASPPRLGKTPGPPLPPATVTPPFTVIGPKVERITCPSPPSAECDGATGLPPAPAIALTLPVVTAPPEFEFTSTLASPPRANAKLVALGLPPAPPVALTEPLTLIPLIAFKKTWAAPPLADTNEP